MLKRQLETVGSVACKEQFHLVSKLSTVDLNIKLVIAN
jgi:hypothetical protein